MSHFRISTRSNSKPVVSNGVAFILRIIPKNIEPVRIQELDMVSAYFSTIFSGATCTVRASFNTYVCMISQPKCSSVESRVQNLLRSCASDLCSKSVTFGEGEGRRSVPIRDPLGQTPRPINSPKDTNRVQVYCLKIFCSGPISSFVAYFRSRLGQILPFNTQKLDTI